MDALAFRRASSNDLIHGMDMLSGLLNLLRRKVPTQSVSTTFWIS